MSSSSNTKNDPKPTHEPASSPDRPAVSQTARRSLCQNDGTEQRHEMKRVREEETKAAPSQEIKRTGSLRAKSPGHCPWQQCLKSMSLALCIVFLSVLAYFVSKKFSDSAKEREILKSLAHSPQISTPPLVPEEDLKPKERCSELVFFVEERERFGLDELFEATADLHSQTPSNSLYKVKLGNIVYAVKRLKKLQVSVEFGQKLRQIGNLKHPNILPWLVTIPLTRKNF